MAQDQEVFLQAVYASIIVAARGGSMGGISVGHTPQLTVTPGEYINGRHPGHGPGYGPNPSTLVPVAGKPTSQFEDPGENSTNSKWYDLITLATCQGSSALKDKQNNEWFCGGCHTTFRGKYEVERHIDTAGMEVRCRYCEGVVNAAPYVLNRHLGATSCLRMWKERGFTGERTVDGAFRA